MKYLPIIYYLIFTMICLNINCTGKSENKEKIEDKISNVEIQTIKSTNSLQDNLILSKSEILETVLQHDTLTIVSTDAFLYYPFGKIKEVTFLNQKLSNMQPEIVFLDNWQKLMYSHSGNKLEFLKPANFDKNDPNTEYIQIFNSNIINSNISLNHNIHVGMSKQALFEKMNVSNNYNSDAITVIELISGLTGIWHYYVFTNDILSLIIIKTDYYLLENHSIINADVFMNRISKLDFVIEKESKIGSLTYITRESYTDNEENQYYIIQVGKTNSCRLEIFYNFYCYPKTNQLMLYEPLSDSLIVMPR